MQMTDQEIYEKIEKLYNRALDEYSDCADKSPLQTYYAGQMDALKMIRSLLK